MGKGAFVEIVDVTLVLLVLGENVSSCTTDIKLVDVPGIAGEDGRG